MGRVFGSSSRAARAKRRLRLRTLIMLALLLFQAPCGVQPTADVLYAVIPSWDDPDTDDGNSVTPLNAADMDKACGHTTLPSPSPRGSRRSSHSRCRGLNPTFSDVIARGPPVAPFHTSQSDLEPNRHGSVHVPTAFTIVHAIDSRLELIRFLHAQWTALVVDDVRERTGQSQFSHEADCQSPQETNS